MSSRDDQTYVDFSQKPERVEGSLGGKYRTKDKSFSINSFCVMMTYPDGDLTKEDILQRIVSRVSDLVGACVGEEISEGGYHHFHVYAESARKRIWTTEELDYFGGLHGHYKPIRETYERALAYCLKDGCFCQEGIKGFDELVKKAILLSYSKKSKPTSGIQTALPFAPLRKPSQMPDLKVFVAYPVKKEDK